MEITKSPEITISFATQIGDQQSVLCLTTLMTLGTPTIMSNRVFALASVARHFSLFTALRIPPWPKASTNQAHQKSTRTFALHLLISSKAITGMDKVLPLLLVSNLRLLFFALIIRLIVDECNIECALLLLVEIEDINWEV